MPLNKRALVRWLEHNKFTEKPGTATSHRQFAHEPSNVVITVPGHGPSELSKKHVGIILRGLEKAGFDKTTTRKELEDA
jgi:predicted RNA binding protein YcfA (HicA-like mRNA interferase family)